AIGYQCGFAYVVAFCVYQLMNLFAGQANVIGVVLSVVVIAAVVYMLVRPYKEATKLTGNVRV
ncbi:MAG: hypothetical protein IJJ88_04900, partial [Oscillospiraceae bacterium]|nr:hypothetical protein [Oscillospiraceae bacterium]